MADRKTKSLGGLSGWTVITFILLVVFSSLMSPRKKVYSYNYQVGDIIRSDIIAPYDFDVLKEPELIRREHDQVLKKVPFIFDLDQDVTENQLDRAQQFFQMAHTLDQRYQKYAQSMRTLELNRYSAENPQILEQTVRTDSNAFAVIVNAFKTEYNLNVKETPFKELYAPSDGRYIEIADLRNGFITHISTLGKQGIADIPLDSIRSNNISISLAGTEEIVSVEKIQDRQSAEGEITENLSQGYPAHDKKVLIARISQLLVKPNLIYDKERTLRRQKEMISRIPLVNGKVYKDEKIVGANTLITPEIYQKLNSLSFAEDKLNSYTRDFMSLIKNTGDFLYMFIVFFSFAVMLFFLDKDYILDKNKFLLISICMALSLVLGSAVAVFIPDLISLVPITVTTILLLAFFDEWVSLLSSFTIMIVLVYIFGESIKFVILHMLPVVLAIYSMKKLKARENVLRPLMFIFLGYAVSVLAVSMATLPPAGKILNLSAFALVNTVLSVLLANGLMMVFEKIFGITTDLTLLELSDMQQPLLKRLSLEAVGTFNHSIIVGNLLESAAEEIGANSLLVRAGAYYHDIGKLSKSEYFIENQTGKANKLDDLKPHMAAKVIISHVREGLELAEKEKLPDEIKQFIATHHGTMRVDYFYDKAQKISGDNELHESEFCYPGPKPTNKETGLLMIVEACEAAVRSLPKATSRTINAKIDEVVQKRLNTGQLDECPLTLSDLTKIKNAIYPMLMGLYHERIPYPEDKNKKSESDEKEKNAN